MNDSSCTYEIIDVTLKSGRCSLSVSRLCDLAGVSRSGYYAWKKAEPLRLAREEQDRKDFDLILIAYRQRGYSKGAKGIAMALLRKDSDAVAEGVREAHQNHASLWKYNDENTLACVIRLAFYNAINEYEIFSEMPAGTGRADLVFLPVKTSGKPALVVELKCGHSAESAIDQIRSRRYPSTLSRYAGRILLAGISYEKDDPEKKHTCIIEEWEKE